MNLRPRIVDLYLARTVLVSILGAWAVLVGFDLLSAFVNELDEIGEGSYTLSHAVLFTAYPVPRRMYDLFPTVALIGMVLGWLFMRRGLQLAIDGNDPDAVAQVMRTDIRAMKARHKVSAAPL